MRKLLALALNDILTQFSDRLDWIFFLALPLVCTAVIGVGLEGVARSDDQRISVAIVDEDGGTLAAELRNVLVSLDTIQAGSASVDEAQAWLDDSEVVAVLNIPANFTQDVLNGKASELSVRTLPDNRALAIKQVLSAQVTYISSIVAIAHASTAEAQKVKSFNSEADQRAYFEKALKLARHALQEPAVSIIKKHAPEATAPTPANGFSQSSPGQLVAWSLITFIGGAAVLADERVRGTLRRLAVMPVSRATIIGGRILGRYSMGLVQMAILIVVGVTVFGVDWDRNPAALVLVVLAFALSATSLGLMVSTFVRTPAQATSATLALSMLLSALGGAWWPLEGTPLAYQAVVKIFPTTWAMIGFTNIIVRGGGVISILPQVGVLLLFAAGFFAIGIWRFKYE